MKPAKFSRSGRRVQRRSRAESRGQSLVEFALILPVLMILVFGIIDFGMGLRSYIGLTNATREGARFGAVGNPAGAYPANCDGVSNTTVVGRVCVSLGDLSSTDLQNVTVSYPTGQNPGDSVVVAAHYHYNYITPLGDIVNFFSAGSLPAYLNLDASTDMRLE